jgi:hypothetical protein
MGIERVAALAADLGVDVDRLVLGRAEDTVPEAPSHRWVLVPTSTGGVVIGGMDRGTFAAYARIEDDEQAARTLARLVTPPAPQPPGRDPGSLRSAVSSLESELVAAADDKGVVPSGHLPVGTPLDHLGNESGHCLYLLDTPMSRRSVPPTDLTEPRVGYLLAGPLPEGCRVRVVEPWFGQPGGGVLVELDRVIAYYCETGLLERFAVDVG